MISGEVLAEVTRGGEVESVHAGHVVALNSDGSILFQKSFQRQMQWLLFQLYLSK